MVRSSYLVDSSFEATNMENIKVRHSTFKKINLKKCILIRAVSPTAIWSSAILSMRTFHRILFHRAQKNQSNVPIS